MLPGTSGTPSWCLKCRMEALRARGIKASSRCGRGLLHTQTWATPGKETQPQAWGDGGNSQGGAGRCMGRPRAGCRPGWGGGLGLCSLPCVGSGRGHTFTWGKILGSPGGVGPSRPPPHCPRSSWFTPAIASGVTYSGMKLDLNVGSAASHSKEAERTPCGPSYCAWQGTGGASGPSQLRTEHRGPLWSGAGDRACRLDTFLRARHQPWPSPPPLHVAQAPPEAAGGQSVHHPCFPSRPARKCSGAGGGPACPSLV